MYFGHFALTTGSHKMAALDERSVVSARDTVVSCELDGGAALLDLTSSKYFSLNEVGRLVWEAIQSPTSLSSLADEVTSRYAVSREACMADLDRLVSRMVEAGLVNVENGHAR